MTQESDMTLRNRKPGTGLGYMISPQAIAKLGADRHTIEDISYRANIIICTCGWQGEANTDAFRSHNREARKAAGTYRSH